MKTKPTFLLALALLTACGCCFAQSGTDSGVAATSQNGKHPFSAYPPGTKFVHTNLVTLNGDTVKSAALDSSVVWYNFWHTRCKPCIIEMEELDRIASAYKDNPTVKFIAIACDDSASVAEFLKTHRFGFQIVALPKTDFLSTFRVSLFPANLLVDASQTVLVEKIGGTLNPEGVREELRELLEQLERLVPEVKR